MFVILAVSNVLLDSPAARMQEERVLHEAKLAKMEAEMKMVFQQKVQEKESKLKQSEEELYARHKEMKDALDKQRADLEEKKRKIESGRPLTPEKNQVSFSSLLIDLVVKWSSLAGYQEKPLPQSLIYNSEYNAHLISPLALISSLLAPFIILLDISNIIPLSYILFQWSLNIFTLLHAPPGPLATLI